MFLAEKYQMRWVLTLGVLLSMGLAPTCSFAQDESSVQNASALDREPQQTKKAKKTTSKSTKKAADTRSEPTAQPSMTAPIAADPSPVKPMEEPAPVAPIIPVQQAAAAQPAVSNESGMKREGILGSLLIAPTLGVQIPVPLTFGLEFRWNSLISLAAESSILPKTKVSGANIEARSVRGVAKVFPWQESFFIGLAVGHQYTKGTATGNALGREGTASIDVETPFITPMIGWQWVGSSGFFWGTEFGWQMPRQGNLAIRDDADAVLQQTQQYKNAERDARDVGERLRDNGLPHFALKIGYYF